MELFESLLRLQVMFVHGRRCQAAANQRAVLSASTRERNVRVLLLLLHMH